MSPTLNTEESEQLSSVLAFMDVCINYVKLCQSL